MKRLWNNAVVKNKQGQVRSGWIILLVMAVFYGVANGAIILYMDVLRRIFIATGELVPSTGYASPLIDWMDGVLLPLTLQVLSDAAMILVPLAAWRWLMKRTLRELGLNSWKEGKREAWVGMVFGIAACTLVFVLVLAIGGARVVSQRPRFSLETLCWILVFVLVAFAEEVMSRGFLMGTLRRTGNIYAVLLIPSVIFGMLHLMNPGVTLLSVVNIVLVGVLFAFIYIRSGNIWMCIGYHFTWNTFQGIIFGMPVSGLNVPGIITTRYQEANLINGGQFGIEGGLLTTLAILLGFLFVWYYYRDSKYDFLSNSRKE